MRAANFFIGTAKPSVEPGTKGLADTASELAKRASGSLHNEYARIPSSQIKDLLIGKLAS